MNISTKGEYGVLAVLELALNGNRAPLQVKAIAKKQNIPYRFLEQVMSALKRNGLVRSIRGAQGGYLLAKPSNAILVGDIIEAIEGPLTPMSCVGNGIAGTCWQDIDPKSCAVHGVWQDVKTSVMNVLNGTTVQDLCDRTHALSGHRTLMYHI
jgi:Rrf2 family cysteine metabolism transcriptional repressor